MPACVCFAKISISNKIEFQVTFLFTLRIYQTFSGDIEGEDHGLLQKDGTSKYESAQSDDKKKFSSWTGILLALLFSALLLIVLSFSYIVSSTFSSAALGSTDSYMTIGASSALWYKFTTSIQSGQSVNVRNFINSYVTFIHSHVDLGCNTTKSVAETYDASLALHWVDSAIFTSSGTKVDDWITYIESLGVNNGFHPFMHNKAQMYVPNLAPLYTKLQADGVTTVTYRLSTSADSSTSNDVAHITIFVPHTGTGYEIVGPASSLSAEALTSGRFTSWQAEECPLAHQLTQSLQYYDNRYNATTYTPSTA